MRCRLNDLGRAASFVLGVAGDFQPWLLGTSRAVAAVCLGDDEFQVMALGHAVFVVHFIASSCFLFGLSIDGYSTRDWVGSYRLIFSLRVEWEVAGVDEAEVGRGM